jgi:DNA repair exonuclease SbcCD ATPase subunit
MLEKKETVSCPHCGYVLKGKDEESIKHIKEELEKQRELLNSLSVKDIETLLKEKQKYDTLLQSMKVVSEKQPKIIVAQRIIQKIENELQLILDKYHCKDTNELTALFMDIMSKEKVFNNLQKQQLDLQNQIEKFNQEIQETKKHQQSVLETKDLIEKYMSLFDIENIDSIPYIILKKLVNYLNTDKVRFVAATSEGKFDINVYIKIGEQWISYDNCSDGQKNFLDIFILIRISAFMNGIGFLAMDEPIANISPQYVIEVGKLLQEIKARTILISSHCHFDGYDRLIKVALGSNGISQITL